ncbi:MAG: D-alanine--D-alanine ligase [bacterium]
MVSAAEFGKVAVLMGGWAAEREISLISGNAVLDALRARGVDAVGVDVGRDILTQLANSAFDRAFVVLHGRGGEDGVIQGGLDILGLPYTGSGVLGSSLGMDKYRTKLLWQGAGLSTPGFALVTSSEQLGVAAELGFPLMVKPAREGSSIGIARVENEAQLNEAWHKAHQLDDQVLIERWVEGDEYTVAILGEEALPAIKLETPNEFYDYAAKYEQDDTSYLIPCGLDEQTEQQIKVLAKRAFDCVGASGWGRVDLMMDGDGNPMLIEINTVPGMTSHSLVPMAARAAGVDFEELVWQILAQTLEGAYA